MRSDRRLAALFTSRVLSLLLLLATSAEAKADFRVLIPVNPLYTVHGQYGSAWGTEIWAYNSGDTGATFAPLLITDWGLRPHTGGLLLINSSPDNAGGTIVLVSGARPDDVSFDVRVRNGNSACCPSGFQVPAVRESEFRPTIQLTGIEILPDHRALLRIYAIDGNGVSVTVRVFDAEVGRELHTQVVTLHRTRATPVHPAVALVTEPFAANVVGGAVSRRLRVEVSSLDRAVPIWAFATVTNNVTQHVRVVAPN